MPSCFPCAMLSFSAIFLSSSLCTDKPGLTKIRHIFYALVRRNLDKRIIRFFNNPREIQFGLVRIFGLFHRDRFATRCTNERYRTSNRNERYAKLSVFHCFSSPHLQSLRSQNSSSRRQQNRKVFIKEAAYKSANMELQSKYSGNAVKALNESDNGYVKALAVIEIGRASCRERV